MPDDYVLDDPLLVALKAARPAGHDEQFSPDSPGAARLLASILEQPSLTSTAAPAPGFGRPVRPTVGSRGGVGRSRRRLAVTAVVLAGVVFIAVALAQGFGGFGDWLVGAPGSPASTAEQRAFGRATRSWAGFPPGTQLRLLTQTTVGGATYTLFGFRAAGALCLRLLVSGNESDHQLACTPLALLRSTTEPALVVAADDGVGQARASTSGLLASLERISQAYVTFGIVADGIQRVEVTNYNGAPADALLGGDAFLTVDYAPSVDEHLTHISAVAGSRRVAIPFTLPGILLNGGVPTAPVLTPHGPSRVERAVHGGTIGWLTRRVPVGTPVAKTIHHLFLDGGTAVYQREIAPDPGAPERLVVSLVATGSGRRVCLNVVSGRYGGASDCWPADELFSTGDGGFGSSNGVQNGVQVSGPYAPFNWINQTQGAGETPGSVEYTTLAGLASDAVADVRLYLGNGQTEPVPLHDNGYIIEAPTVDYPLRLVAYNSHGLVIGIVTFSGQAAPRPLRQAAAPEPVPNAHWRLLTTSSAGYVFAAPATDGGGCYAITNRGGGGAFGCQPPLAAAALQVEAFGLAQTLALTIFSGPAITHLTIHYQNGHTQTLATPDGVAQLAIPSNDQGATFGPLRAGVATIAGLNAHGQTIAARSIGTITTLTPTTITIRDTPTGSAKPVTTTCSRAPSSPLQLPNGQPYRDGDQVVVVCANGQLTTINPTEPPR